MLKKISKVIYDLNRRGKTFLIIEHNMKFIMEIAHKIVVLNYGKKIVENSPDCIQRDPKVIKAYLGTTYDFDS
jgi:branched-chain amino acid transport system ATP-binding protein